MLAIVISNFEPIKSYIRNSIRNHEKVSKVIQLSNMKDITPSKIESLINEHAGVIIILDLDQKVKLVDKKVTLPYNIVDVVYNLDKDINIKILIVGNNESLEENKSFVTNNNIVKNQILNKPFNGKSFENFLNVNIPLRNAIKASSLMVNSKKYYSASSAL
ncbi:hypothetical protein [Vibrio sp. AND4]|uniref:hypothetical protein n=1 Tax=Vibrio sp. AND4 TaxID=314289 RepID=UPI00015F3055|nr:hypothetical protein [Vibrio sp. AND4]EDP60395.1 hypothetical protein AND4_05744 [Vibrio sp. AND4]